MRECISFQIDNISVFKKKLLAWAGQFSRCCVLDSNKWQNSHYEMLIACDAIEEILPTKKSFEALGKFHKTKKDWLFGYLSYDLKNETEGLTSENQDKLQFPLMHFFQPRYVFRLSNKELKIEFLPELASEKKVKEVFHDILSATLPSVLYNLSSGISCRSSKQEYTHTVDTIRQHIQRGDIYEMNYCVEFFAEETRIEPRELFLKLSETSQTPFSAFYRSGDNYLMCASPERFLKKTGRKIISQPIKGTAKRGRNFSEDEKIKGMLSQNEKEKSENVMIVDLVRNDLSKTCDNVKVDELFGIYTFKQWHQMISTVSGELREGVDLTEVIKTSLPMGSMTGAPKVRAMELIEHYEKTKRGLYSGAVGYLTPEGDFDFNVVIRSILYNAASKYLSFQVGSAITVNSIPENEYEECFLKAKGMFEALGQNNKSGIGNDKANTLAHA